MKIDESKAWEAMNNYDPQKALDIWGELISREDNEERKAEYMSHSCYALLALNRIDDARKIYQELFQKSNSHVYAHQLCMVEREAGNYERALEYLAIEQSLIDEDNILAVAANLYELGKVNELMKNFEEALDFSMECLELSLQCDDLVMLACANRLLGDVYAYSESDEAVSYYLQAQKIFHDLGDSVSEEEIEDKIVDLDG